MCAERVAARTAVLLLALIFTVPAAAMPEIRQWETANGARVLFVETREIPLIEAQVTFAAGSARDGEHPGRARMVSDLLMSGTGTHDAGELAAAFEQRGAEVSTGAARDMGWVEFRSLSDDEQLWPVVELVAGLMAQPAFPDDEVERIRDGQLTDIEDAKQKPGTIAQREFWRALYGDHPYAHPPTGSEESLTGIGREELRTFHRQYYVASNASIAIVGDLDRDEAERLAEELSGQLPTGSPAAELPPVPPRDEPVTIEKSFPSSQAHVIVGHAGVARGDERWPVLQVANHVFGGGGFTSRLMDEVRQKRGLVYGVSSRLSPMAAEGPFRITLQTRVDQTDEALELVRAELERFVEEGPTEQEVTDAQRNIVGGFPLQIDSNAELAGYLAMMGFYELPPDYLQRFLDEVEAVDREAVHEAARSLLQDRDPVTIIVGGDRDSDDGD